MMSSDSDGAESLNNDLLIEVLCRLQPEALVRFRGVCKSWFSTISDFDFNLKHQQQNVDNSRLLILTRSESMSSPLATFSLYTFPDGNPKLISPNIEQNNTASASSSWRFVDACWRMEGICNGLFCYTGYRDNRHHDFIIYLCKPSIRWRTVIPDYCFPRENCLSIYHEFYGVGFDPVQRDYKILKTVVRSQTPHRYHGAAAIFSLKSKSWRAVKCPCPDRNPIGPSNFHHGSIHWLCDHPVGEVSVGCQSIMCFDVRNEAFGELALPETLRYRFGSVSLYTARGSICVVATGKFEGRSHHYRSCEVWRMEEYGVVESWTMLFKVVLPGEMDRRMEVTAEGKILCMSCQISARNGRLVCGRSSVGWPPFQLMLFDPLTDEFANVCKKFYEDDFFSIDCSVDFQHD